MHGTYAVFAELRWLCNQTSRCATVHSQVAYPDLAAYPVPHTSVYPTLLDHVTSAHAHHYRVGCKELDQ